MGKSRSEFVKIFGNSNAATKKDYFPLPFTDIILDHVAGQECYSFLDGFSGYNQVSIREEDQLKTTFTTEWGTFAFNRMPFGLCNAPGTFQRLMVDIFRDFLRHFLEVFIDDFAVFSKWKEHLEYLRRTFQRCRETGLKLHPGKCFMGMISGILLGHIVSRNGLEVDSDKVRSYPYSSVSHQRPRGPGIPRMRRILQEVYYCVCQIGSPINGTVEEGRRIFVDGTETAGVRGTEEGPDHRSDPISTGLVEGIPCDNRRFRVVPRGDSVAARGGSEGASDLLC